VEILRPEDGLHVVIVSVAKVSNKYFNIDDDTVLQLTWQNLVVKCWNTSTIYLFLIWQNTFQFFLDLP